jgi:hypothetical protein
VYQGVAEALAEALTVAGAGGRLAARTRFLTDVFGTSARQILQAAQSVEFECEYRYQAWYSTLTAALSKRIPPIVAVNPNILHARTQRLHAKHDIVLLETARNRIIYHEPEGGGSLSVSPAVFKEAWQQAHKEVILIWPTQQILTKISRR